MSEALDLVYKSIDERHSQMPAASRRKFVAGAAATVGSLGLLNLTDRAAAGHRKDTTQHILDVAATAEVLATIVNTVGFHRGLGGDSVTQRNIKAAAREELVHYRRLREFGGKPLATKIWIPDAVFKNRTSFLNTLQVGDQIFINAYLIAVKHFGALGSGKLATISAEFMGVEAVHRALARQSLGLLGNDRVFMKYDQREMAPGAPNQGTPGFEDIDGAVRQLSAAGIGFGTKGASPGRFFSFFKVMKRTPNDPALNTFFPQAT